MELDGSAAVEYLNGHNTVRDGALVSLSVRHIVTAPVIELIFEIPHKAGLRIVKLELQDIKEFDYFYTKENPPGVIQLVKCLMTDAGDFYLSLDPYDERETFVSEKDSDFFRSGIVRLTVNASI